MSDRLSRRRTTLRRAARSIVENLETRRLMHAGHDHGTGLETLRVDAGATAAYTDTQGRTWLADSGFAGGGTDNTAFAVSGTTDPKLYTSRRAGTFGYSSPAADGSYTLNLHFADYKAAGQRRFNVAAEGQSILTNFDIAAAAGGANKALVRSFNVNVTGGALDLQFSSVVGNPVVSAFELIPNAPTPVVPPKAPTQLNAAATSHNAIQLSWADAADNNETGYEIERSPDGVTFSPLATGPANVTQYSSGNLSASTKYFYRVRAVNGAGESAWTNVAEATTLAQPTAPGNAGTVIRVDAGGAGSYTDKNNIVWAKDNGFVGGGPNTSTFAVANTEDDSLFATRRTGDFTYSRAVPNGDYTLRLLFADPNTSAGTRKFNVNVEGQQVLTNYDIVAEAGSKAATVKTFNVTVIDGSFDMAFKSLVGYASLSAFELFANGPEVVPAAPSNLVATPAAGKIGLAWQDNSLNEWSFQVFRSVNGGAFSLVATRNMESTTYDDLDVDAANTYAYHVKAVNAAGASEASNTAGGKPLAGSPVDTFTKVAWATRASSPVGKAEALHAVIDGKIYVFAGFAGSAGPVTRSDVYDPATNTWTRIADMPTRLTHAGVASVGRDVYFAGGYIGTGPGYQQQFGVRQVWRYNVDSNTYSAMPDLPAALASGGLVAVGRKLHYFGGNNASRQDVAAHYALDLDNLAAGWVAKKSMTTARSHMGYVNLGGLVYAIAGQKGNDETLTAQSTVEVYDPATDAWSPRASMPKGVNHISGATFVMGGRILTVGGQTAHGSAIADVYAYDPVANKWATLTPLPAARFSGVAGAVNGAIYFTTGSNQTTTWRGTPG